MFITRHSTKLAHAIRRPCPCPRPRRTLSSKSVNKDELINQILAQVEKDRNFISKVLEKAPSEEARHKIVRPIASHVGKVLDKEFAIADLDGNSQLSAIEIRNWYKQKYPSFRVAETMTGIRENISSAGRGEVAAEPTSTQHRQLAIQAGIPFIGFGFLDNAIMLVAGNQIEASMGVAFGITPLFAAGLGNMVSDVAGLKAGGVIEAIAAKLGLPDPGLSASQMKLSSVKRTTLLAGALGLAVGCLLGMFPLLFIDEHENMIREIFEEIDADHSGTISEIELETALSKLGVGKDEVQNIMHLADLNGNKEIDFEEFKKMAKVVKGNM